jgi:hypothetical protein
MPKCVPKHRYSDRSHDPCKRVKEALASPLVAKTDSTITAREFRVIIGTYNTASVTCSMVDGLPRAARLLAFDL